MKKYLLLVLLCVVVVLAGCGSKSNVFVVDIFDIPFYHNGIVYEDIVSDPIEGMEIFKEMRATRDANETGYINSLFVIKTSVASGIQLETIVQANTKDLQLKLIQYIQDEYKARSVKCKEQEYPGYSSTFTYQLRQEALYGAQYYLLDDTSLYMISLTSINEKDIKKFIKGIKKISCN